MSHARNYSYDDPATYPSVDPSSQAGYSYSNPYPRYEQQGPAQQYYLPPPASNPQGQPIDPRYRSSTPMAPQRYPRTAADPRYSPPSELMSPASTSTNSGYYNSSQYPAPPSGDRFIPTPSDLAHSAHSYYPNQQTSQSPGMYSTPGHHPSSRHTRNPSSSSPVLTGRPNNPSRSSSMAPATTERYPCDMCGKTFSRSHDRKRHHETQHTPCPVLHRCRYCRKEFSRADSLKRHLDNGCDEMPSAK
ncbi:hypothetical protein E1B28_000270 [Marasmius oreades]|uniref:C2H2-type domain-containing protein n=1 Tax=Marasmius oreades TaxID=181124 RepID=A0A9P8AE63_9AGAR|nr:uncharacterized protein E1B28_000270 [Marasmius oreades]KAG7098309.1 hypothetical protein E1B28_000270 [Marasmius oreades]